MKKNFKFIILLIFFSICFLSILTLNHTKRKADTLLTGITNQVEINLNKIFYQHIKNPVISQTYLNIPTRITYFRTTDQQLHAPHNFAEVHLKEISPLTCHFILKTANPRQMRLFINNEEKFFGSDSSICFQKLKNEIFIYFEIYNYTSDYAMKEPKLCYSSQDCSNNSEICFNGYCKNITNQ